MKINGKEYCVSCDTLTIYHLTGSKPRECENCLAYWILRETEDMIKDGENKNT